MTRAVVGGDFPECRFHTDAQVLGSPLPNVCIPPTAADCRPDTDGPQSTLSGDSAQRKGTWNVQVNVM